MSSHPIVGLNNATIYQANRVVLDNVTFSILQGEFVFLTGKTGSGKSSLLRTLYADLPAKGDAVKVAGYNLIDIQKKEVPFLRRKLGIVFQDFQLLTDRNVGDNLEFVLKSTGWKDNSLIKRKIYNSLMRVGLSSVEKKMPHQLSGGEQQRVVIARSLLNDPLIILADEPTGNLDPVTSLEILSIFKKINAEGTAVLMATHNHQFITTYERNILCDNGKISIS